jgi:hypothetical protein
MAKSPKFLKPNYSTSVFVNCPFDVDYQPLFRALIFTIQYCGYSARCALEVHDSGETRAEKLIRLIRGSRLGIHDISRTESNAEGLPRFNMPYEFGIFAGYKHGGGSEQRKKVILVLDREQYRYQRFLSDIAGQDIKSHGGDPMRLIAVVRDWLQSQTMRKIFGGVYVGRRFDQFLADLPNLLAELHKTERDLDNYRDFHTVITNWIAANNSSE